MKPFLSIFFAGLVLASVSQNFTNVFAGDLPEGLSSKDWPWWRGPGHDGVASDAAKTPKTWSDKEHVRWSVPIEGRGHGSPIVVGEHVYLATCEEGTGSQSILCYHKSDGHIVWNKEIFAQGAMRKNERSTGASSTLACDGKSLFANFLNSGAVTTFSLSLKGDVQWKTKISDYIIHQGYGSSPFIYKNLVIVSADNKGGGAVAGLDRKTGDIVWRRDRPATPNYSSPIVHSILGKDQLIMTGCDRVISYQPLTGETLWEREGATTECVTTTVTDGKHVYSSGGYPKNHVAAILADGSGKVAWENGERVYVPSLLHKDGYLYAVLDAGIAVCWKSDTGVEQWKERLGGNFSASPVLVGDLIYATSEGGETTIFRANPKEFEKIGSNQLGEEAFATPTICGGAIYFRIAITENGARKERLVCISE